MTHNGETTKSSLIGDFYVLSFEIFLKNAFFCFFVCFCQLSIGSTLASSHFETLFWLGKQGSSPTNQNITHWNGVILSL